MKHSKIKLFTLCIMLGMLLLSACGGDGKKKMLIFGSGRSEEYLKGAEKYFNAEWRETADPAHAQPEEIGDARYVVFISDDSSVTIHPQLEAPCYTLNVYDPGNGDINVSALYYLGTTAICVTKGNVSDGMLRREQAFTIDAANISDPTERAKLIFNAIKEEIVQ